MFLGYRMVGLAFLTNFISVGFGFYSYGVFFKTLAREFGGSRLAVSAGLTSLQLMSGLCAPFVGRWLDRGQSRHVMTLGALLLGTGFVLASRISALAQFYLIFGLVMGSAVPMLGGVSSSTLVANWFVQRRGAALGVAAMGISVSGVVMPPVGTYLIDSLGWRSTFLVYATVALGVVLPAVLFGAVHRPEDIGQQPDGIALGASPGEAHEPEVPPSSGAILSQRIFWVIAAVIALNFSALGALLTHAVPHATDLGFSPEAAALVLSAMAGAGSIGKPLFGALADRIDKRSAVAIAASLQLCGSALFTNARSYPLLLCAALVFGLGMGGIVPLQGALIGAAFGRRAFGRAMGLLALAMIPLNVVSSPLAGYVFDQTGSYDLAFTLFTAMFALSLVALMFLRLPAVEPGAAEAVPASARAS